MIAVGGNGPDPTTVFGLRYAKPDGSDAVWARLASLPTGVAIWSFAAADDATIYVGTAPPHVFRLDLSERGWTPTELPGMPSLVPGQPDPDAAITRIVVLPDGSITVAYNQSSYASGCSTGQILHRDVGSRNVVPAERARAPASTCCRSSGWTPIRGERCTQQPTTTSSSRPGSARTGRTPRPDSPNGLTSATYDSFGTRTAASPCSSEPGAVRRGKQPGTSPPGPDASRGPG